MTYNASDYAVHADREVKDDGTVVNASNGINPDGSRNVQITGNSSLTLASSSTRTATLNTQIQTLTNRANALILTLDVTAASGTGGLTIFIRVYDPVTNKIATYPGSPAITATGTYMFIVGLGASGAANNVKQALSLPVPSKFDVQVYHSDTSSYTYSLGQILLA